MHATQYHFKPRHCPTEHPREISQVSRRHTQKFGLMRKRQNVDFPFVAAGKGFYGYKPFTAFDDILSDVDTSLYRP